MSSTIQLKRSKVGAGNANIIMLAHFDGANNATAFTDTTNRHKFTASGGAKLTTTPAPKFGTASLLLTTTASTWVTVTDPQNDFAFGTADWTIDFQCYFTLATQHSDIVIINCTAAHYMSISTDGSGNLFLNFDADPSGSTTGTDRGAVISTALPTLNAWHHICVEKQSGIIYLFIDGVLRGSYTDARNWAGTSPALQIGNTNYFTGYIDELRIIRGYAAFAVTGFTSPTAAYTLPAVGNVPSSLQAGEIAFNQADRTFFRRQMPANIVVGHNRDVLLFKGAVTNVASFNLTMPNLAGFRFLKMQFTDTYAVGNYDDWDMTLRFSADGTTFDAGANYNGAYRIAFDGSPYYYYNGATNYTFLPIGWGGCQSGASNYPNFMLSLLDLTSPDWTIAKSTWWCYNAYSYGTLTGAGHGGWRGSIPPAQIKAIQFMSSASSGYKVTSTYAIFGVV